MSPSSSSKPSKPSAKTRASNRGLGRGLDALLGDRGQAKPDKPARDTPSDRAQTGSVTGQEREVPIEYLMANPDQPRKTFHDDAIADLANSIREKGLLQPILVRPIETPTDQARYEIVAGERRWRAAQKAQLHQIPVIIRALNDQETAEIALIENIQRVDLNVMEEAEAYHHLRVAHKRTQQEIADAVGKSRSHVANLMRLTDLPKSVQAGVRDNTISMGHARALLTSENPADDYQRVKKDNLSVRQTEALVKRLSVVSGASNNPKTTSTEKPINKDADTRALERNLAEALGLTVGVDHQKSGAGSVTINYLNLDQLDEVCRRLLGSSV